MVDEVAEVQLGNECVGLRAEGGGYWVAGRGGGMLEH